MTDRVFRIPAVRAAEARRASLAWRYRLARKAPVFEGPLGACVTGRW